ncbi:hypothetical protein BGW38_000098 [Lunasporangiospora selenospora]|uniref:Microbial-type PARG catalytic domain-containing protein n=1 Tax=Lunasporangiospora selenospora TaxID=979761 RepID=A0A9P6KI95_9FUNG|nr:hypothetical protein BGW38_000098 [Lunasporangiospora selenospora]
MPPGANKKRDSLPPRPLSVQQKLLIQQQQQQYHVKKPITIRPNSMTLPGGVFTFSTSSSSFSSSSSSSSSLFLPQHQRPQSRFGKIVQYGQQLFHKIKRFHRKTTRRYYYGYKYYSIGGHDLANNSNTGSQFIDNGSMLLERNWRRIVSSLAIGFFVLWVFSRLLGVSIFGFLSFGQAASSSLSPAAAAALVPLSPRIAETVQAFELLQYVTPSGKTVRLDSAKLFSGVRRARLYQGNSRIRRQIMDSQQDPVIQVVEADSLDEALRLKRLGFKPLVLDMASREIPGGDYRLDGLSQEAGLFRRTNLFQCLDMEPRRSEFYPLPSQGGVYCPNMLVLRKSNQNNNELMDRPDWMSFLAMAPLRNPPLIPNEANKMILGERAAIITKKKIQNMFRIALENGHDAIVLSAFGCGRLHNPADSMAKLFKEVIKTNYMGGIKKGRTFAAIVFAITPTTNLKEVDEISVEAKQNPRHHFETFKQIMESPDEPATSEMEGEI